MSEQTRASLEAAMQMISDARKILKGEAEVSPEWARIGGLTDRLATAYCDVARVLDANEAGG